MLSDSDQEAMDIGISRNDHYVISQICAIHLWLERSLYSSNAKLPSLSRRFHFLEGRL